MKLTGGEQTVTHQQVEDIGRCQRLLPTEAQFKGRKGYKRKYREDGTYEWKYEYTPNVRGKLTREAHEVLEMMTPFSKADTARHSAMQAKVPRAALRDAKGGVRFIDPGLADQAARAHGWSHVIRVGRTGTVEPGVDGMLFRPFRDGWEPTGRTTLGLNGRIAPRDSVQHDPDGRPWRWIRGAWRRTA